MKVLRFLAVLLLVCSIPFRVFALDNDFTTPYWFWNKPCQNIPLTDGFCTYYIDTDDKCFYMQLGCDTKNLITDNEVTVVNLHFEINGYSFNIIDEIGDRESTVNNIKIYQKFSELQGSGQDIYIGMDFNKSEYKKTNNTLDITLTVNGNTAYPILENIPLDFGSDEDIPTTANQSTTKAKDKEEITTAPNTATEKTDNTSTTKKPTTEPTTKFKYTGSDVSQTTTGKNTETTASNETKQSTATVPTTKFVHTTDTNNSNSEDNVNYDNDNMNAEVISDTTTTQPPTTQKEAEIIIPETQSGNSLSPQAKLFIALAVIFIAFGIAMIFRALAKKEKVEAEENEVDEDE